MLLDAGQKLDKKAAISALKRYYRGKKFLPGAFSGNNHITKIQGVYIQSDYKITEVEEYRILREGEAQFQRIPVDGSTKMPDAHMDSIEPFDYGELTDFSTAYLPGFLAEKYDVDKNESQSRATERMEKVFPGCWTTPSRDIPPIESLESTFILKRLA